MSETRRETRLEYLRPDEIRAEQARRPLAFLPTGSIEWHGPHLPLGVDMMLAHEAAMRAAAAIGGVVHPAIFCGTERERRPEMLRDIGFGGDEWIVGMDFPANAVPSLYYPEEVFAISVREALTRLVELGYREIVIVNGHGAENQIAPLCDWPPLSPPRPARGARSCPSRGYLDGAGAAATLGPGSPDIFETGRHCSPCTGAGGPGAPAGPGPPPCATWTGRAWDGSTFSGHPTPETRGATPKSYPLSTLPLPWAEVPSSRLCATLADRVRAGSGA